jgi:hypothetical protein
MQLQVDPSKISIGPDGKVIIDDQAVLTHLAVSPDAFGTTNRVCSNNNTACTNVVDCGATSNDGACKNQGLCAVSTITPPT